MAEPKSKSLRQVLADGDQAAALAALRDAIAADLESCDAKRDKAALYSRLMDVMQRIDQLGTTTQKGDAVDEIAARRSARRAVPAKGAARAKRPG